MDDFLGLGDLPGGIFFSRAFGVNADGSVVVGFGISSSGPEAFRWTQAGGMQSIAENFCPLLTTVIAEAVWLLEPVDNLNLHLESVLF